MMIKEKLNTIKEVFFNLMNKLKSLIEKIANNEKLAPVIFTGPYFLIFTIFIVLAVFFAILLSFTNFNTIEFPKFIFFDNYINLITKDNDFITTILPNTIKFALIVGPCGYFLSFLVAWLLAQVPHKLRTVLAIIMYSPSMTMGVAMAVLWKAIFSGDQAGYLNSILINLNVITTPIQWLQSPQHLMNIMIIVSLWSSMGVGFLAMISGILNIDKEIYEAAYMDGLKSKTQEIFLITIPMMKPQMLFGAVMALVNTFQSGNIGVSLSGSNPTPQNAGQLIVTHIEDYGFIRYEMGYASAISVVLLLIILLFSKVANNLFTERD